MFRASCGEAGLGDGPEGELPRFPELVQEFLGLGGELPLARLEEGVEVLGLGHAALVHEVQVVTRVVGHHDDRPGVEAFEEERALVVHGHVDRAAEPVHAPGRDPGRRRVDEGPGRLRIVEALVEPEEARPVLVRLVMVPVDDGRDAADGPPVPEGQEILGLAVLEEGVLAAVEPVLHVRQEGRDPVRVALVDGPGEPDEELEVAVPSRPCGSRSRSWSLLLRTGRRLF